VGHGQDLDWHVDAVALTSLEEAIVLKVDFEHVLHLEDLTHPGRAQILVLGRIYGFVAIVMESSFVGTRVLVDYRATRAISKTRRLVAAVFLHHRYLER